MKTSRFLSLPLKYHPTTHAPEPWSDKKKDKTESTTKGGRVQCRGGGVNPSPEGLRADM